MLMRGIGIVIYGSVGLGFVATMAGCPGGGTQVEIGPGELPLVKTPSIKVTVPPGGGGLATLPSGFQICDDKTFKVDFPNSTYTNVRVCIYCSTSETNNTVYVRYNCEGNYFEGVRVPNPGQPTTSPPAKSLSAVEGSFSFTGSSAIAFTVDEAFDTVDVMKGQMGADMVVNGLSIQEWEAVDVHSFAKGAEVSISGEYPRIAEILFWGFGRSEISVLTDDDRAIQMQLGFNEDIGVVAVPFEHGEALEEGISFMSWHGD